MKWVSLILAILSTLLVWGAAALLPGLAKSVEQFQYDVLVPALPPTPAG